MRLLSSERKRFDVSTTPKLQPAPALVAQRTRSDAWRVTLGIVPILAFVLSLVVTWLLVAPPWSVRATVGGADSALLGSGFYTKEVTAQGVPFRWTNGPAVFRVPYLRSSYLVSFLADTATGEPYSLKLLDGQHRWATVELQPGFRRYHILWPSAVEQHWPAGLGSRDFTLLAEARPLREGDDRIYGAAFAEFAARDLEVGNVPTVPLLLVGLTLGSLGWLLRPLDRLRRLAFGLVALVLPLLYNVLVWRPPTAGNYTWLPFTWLPWIVMLATTGVMLAVLARRGTRGALLACAVVVVVFTLLLISLNVAWKVDGPDYGWHLNHGGSWERVLRAHRFYPFGFPLVLYLGQLLGDMPLAFGRAAGALATLTTLCVTVGLVWRMHGRVFAWLGGAVLLGAPIVLAYGVLASTDAPMATCAALAFLALCWRTPINWRGSLFGGIALGVGYLFRFQAMILVAPVAFWLLFQPRTIFPRQLSWLQRTGRFGLPLVFLVGFVLASSPQWLLDFRDFGRPYVTAQYVNIWTFAYGKQEGLPEGSAAEQLWYILNYDPSLLWRHWAGNLRQTGVETLHGALIWPFGVLALMGIAVMVIGVRDRRYLLLALSIAAYVASVALTYNKERFFLPVMPALVVFAVAVVRRATQRFEARRWQLIVLAACGAAIWCWAMLHLIDGERELILYLIP